MVRTGCKSWLVVLALGLAPVLFAAPDSERRQSLRYLLLQDCGSCHGMTLKGGLGPSLLPEDLRGRPDELLVGTILDGRPGTPMPPWRGELDEQDARYLVQLLRSGVAP